MSAEDAVKFDADSEEELEVDENAPDWTQFQKLSALPSAPFIPIRGDKDFTPVQGDSAQSTALAMSRNALFTSLSVASIRSHNASSIKRLTWHASTGRGSMVEDGWLPNLGRYERGRRRREFLPEEVIWLMDLGSVEVWKEGKEGLARMSFQQVLVECIGVEGLTLERYHVYAHLKRLGYIVVRPGWHAAILAEDYASAIPSPPSRHLSILQRFLALFSLVLPFSAPTPKQLEPLVSSSVRRTWGSIYTSLRLTSPPTPIQSAPLLPATHPLTTFFYVYRPSTTYLRKSPPPPEWHLAILSARRTRLPTPDEFALLLSQVPSSPAPSIFGVFARPWLTWFVHSVLGYVLPPRWNNVIRVLKTGRRNVLLAVVDSGVITWLRFWEIDGGGWEIIEGDV
ncbi:hypothetical protein BT69DRAFT_1341524 [Atractiella rhizophila]|nr:hypothetical protein BT69DRAFT_1341524 [Atractiella rhizophila]